MSSSASAQTPLRFQDVQALARHILQQASNRRRTIVAIAGIPGAGKSTLARHLRDALEHIAQQPGIAIIVPQDGFHMTNAELTARGLLPRKGSPPTYRAAALFTKLVEIRRAARPVLMPVYSRELHEPIPDAIEVRPDTPFVLVEGNYLLCQFGVWQSIAGLFDLKIFCEVAPDTARKRVVLRHHKGGVTLEEAIAKYDRNDAPNSELILSTLAAPDIVFDGVLTG